MSADRPEMSEASHFEPHVGKTFRFHGGGRELRLDRILREPAGPSGVGRRAPFTLIFTGPRLRDVLPEGLYDCEVEGAPAFALYVAPIHTPAPDRQDYQATFN